MNAEEYADKFESYEPKPGDRGRVTPIVLRMAAYKRAHAESDLDETLDAEEDSSDD